MSLGRTVGRGAASGFLWGSVYAMRQSSGVQRLAGRAHQRAQPCRSPWRGRSPAGR